eukprot:scaffold19315_cov83-Skeletonema_dohrnii-CCMP3373.AAC.1
MDGTCDYYHVAVFQEPTPKRSGFARNYCHGSYPIVVKCVIWILGAPDCHDGAALRPSNFASSTGRENEAANLLLRQ